MYMVSMMTYLCSVRGFGHPVFLKPHFGHPVMKILAKTLVEDINPSMPVAPQGSPPTNYSPAKVFS